MRVPVVSRVRPTLLADRYLLTGNMASNGVEITAIVEGEIVATTFTSSDGRYKLKVQQGAQSLVDKTVTFTVDGEIASQASIWRQGGADLLDLAVWSGPRPVAEVFSGLIDDGSLVTVWKYDNATQSWSLFDPRSEAALLSDLTEVSSRDILWVEVSRQSSLQDRTIYKGWNLIALR